MEVRNRIMSLRKQHKMSGIKLAEILEISAPYFYDLEKGKRNLSADMAGKLADIFKVTADYLLCKADVNLYDYSVSSDGVKEKEDDKNSNSMGTESEQWFDIPIEDLAKHDLTYKGRKLNDEQKQHFIKIIQAAADMLKQ
jgi:transcriptional regulator with XRE-family HTH domain